MQKKQQLNANKTTTKIIHPTILIKGFSIKTATATTTIAQQQQTSIFILADSSKSHAFFSPRIIFPIESNKLW